jgi:hypothetical protein
MTSMAARELVVMTAGKAMARTLRKSLRGRRIAAASGIAVVSFVIGLGR